MERNRRMQKESPIKVEEAILAEAIDKEKFIEATKKHINAIAIVEGNTSGVYTFLASLYMADVISLEDLQQVGRHIKMSENTFDYDEESCNEED